MSENSGESRIRLPSKTTPTWEVELLISGALVFALLQGRDAIELWFVKWISVAVEPWDSFVVYGYVYGKLVLLVLVATFILHIGARAAWVALVGVNSVYPNGANWDNFAGGPIGKRLAQSMVGDVDAAVERADNRAALVFAYGILAAKFSIAIFVVTMLVLGIVAAFSVIGLGREAGIISACALLIPSVLGGIADRLFGKRIAEGTWLERLVRFCYRWSQLMALGRFAHPLLSLITTNIGGKRGTWVLIGVIYLGIAAAGLDTIIATGKLNVYRDDSLPSQDRAHASSAVHYGSERDAQLQFSTAPFIPDRVIEEPYLRLRIPFDPARHEDAMREHCPLPDLPNSKPVDDAEDGDQASDSSNDNDTPALQRARQQTDCFLRLHQLRLDGETLEGVSAEQYRDPATEQDGVLVMIDVRSLSPGRHQLSIVRLPRGPSQLWGGGGGKPVTEHISFWR